MVISGKLPYLVLQLNHYKMRKVINGTEIIETEYIISYGKGRKMYTLWVDKRGYGPELKPWGYTRYLQNLSIDKDNAIAKAMEMTGFELDEMEITDRDLKDIQYGDDILRFGKYVDCKVQHLTDVKYLNWLAKGAKVKKEVKIYNSVRSTSTEMRWMTIDAVLKYPQFIEIAKDRLIELGEWSVFNGRKMGNDRIAKVKSAEQMVAGLKFGHHFTDGQRVKGVELFLLDSFSFEGHYGITYVATFQNAEGQVFKYKGGSDWYKIYNYDLSASYLVPGTENVYRDASVIVMATFTVKHNEYRGEKETLISRPKKDSFRLEQNDEAILAAAQAYKLYKSTRPVESNTENQ